MLSDTYVYHISYTFIPFEYYIYTYTHKIIHNYILCTVHIHYQSYCLNSLADYVYTYIYIHMIIIFYIFY